jgi:hypothetical protein
MKYVIKPSSKIPVPKKGTTKGTDLDRKFVPIKKESFIRKCIRIIIDDIKYKIYGETSQDRQMWNDYQHFCDLARGKK